LAFVKFTFLKKIKKIEKIIYKIFLKKIVMLLNIRDNELKKQKKQKSFFYKKEIK